MIQAAKTALLFFALLILGFILSILLTNIANASIISADGNGIGTVDRVLTTPPASVTSGFYTQFWQVGFDELQGVALPVDTATYGGVLPAGLVVDSHFIMFDKAGVPGSDMAVTWVFDKPIVGIMVDSMGAHEVASSPYLGLPGTIYPNYLEDRRGIEVFPGNPYSDTLGVIGSTLYFGSHVTYPGDHIRILTSSGTVVPEPPAWVCWTLIVGLVSCAWVISRRLHKSV